MSLSDSQGQLSRSLQDLLLHWERTRGTWRDNRARRFEATVLQPLHTQVMQATKAMEMMAGNLHRVRSECARLSDS